MAQDELFEFYEALHGQSLTEPTNEQDVKNILGCIRAMHGYLDSDDQAQLQKTTSAFQKKLGLMTSKSRQVLARFTKIVSTELYDDPFRFFVELIQNADDARYSRAGEVPAISFTVTSTELRVDLNEDGFSLADVLSICDTAQSSKSGDEETTGEKGFGFKAVFSIADRVHVQSGLWSFRFDHQSDEDGLGMISPIWESREVLPANVRTRFRLRFTVPGQTSLENICERLEAQHASVIFALRKIRKLTITFADVLGRNYTICFEEERIVAGGITKITSYASGQATKHIYRTFSRETVDMPTQQSRPRQRSVITIGLPVTAEKAGLPKLSSDGQFIFAYLPIMQMPQLPFLIQADFLLPGSRQAVSDNLWNRKLRSEVAHLFALSISEIVRENSRMSYDWPMYLPTQQITGFWQPLQDDIKQCLLGKQVFYSRLGELFTANQVRILPNFFRHGDEPLLSETARPWHFLSASYTASQMPTLRLLGVQALSYDEAFQIVDDHTSSNNGTLYTTPLDNVWHTSFTIFIQKVLDLNTASRRTQIYERYILPVRVKEELHWYRPGFVVYFPNLVDEGGGSERIVLDIPAMLDLCVLHPQAAKHLSRRKVYEMLGVRNCPSKTVCVAIEAAQAASGPKPTIGLVNCLELLFWYSHSFSFGAKDNIIAGTAVLTYAKSRNLYMRSKEPYHAETLLRLSENPDQGKHFINELYQKSLVSTRSRGGLTWEQWLRHVAGIRWFPPLQDQSERNKLHWMIEAIRGSNPAMFIPFIQTYWSQEYEQTCKSNQSIQQALMRCEVLCENGKHQQLQKTWFPTNRIKTVARYLAIDRNLSVLSLPESTENHLVSQWPCLQALGVSSVADLSFLREALALLCFNDSPPNVNIVAMTWLYKNIGGLMKLEDRITLKVEFSQTARVWDPIKTKWRRLDECVWSCTIPLSCKFVLTATYNENDVSGLFRTMLNVGDVTIAHLIDELRGTRESSWSNGSDANDAHLSSIYTLLKDMATDIDDRTWLRPIFKNEALIYSKTRKCWLKSDSCVWHSTIKVGDNVPIANDHLELRAFFVEVLGVNTVTDIFMMKELASAAKKQRKVAAEIKNLMLSTSVLLNNNTDLSKFDKSLEILRQNNFLPCSCPSGEIKLCSVNDEFFIVDNQYYSDMFSGKLIVLDFTYEQLNSLHRLLEILHLGKHYLTKNVSTETSAESSTLDTTLTEQFRQCAYAISCCAIAHISPRYSNQDSGTHSLLLNTEVRLSSNMTTKLVVTQDKMLVKIDTSKASLIVEQEQDRLLITLPSTEEDRCKCMRNALPQRLAELLQMDISGGERQVYRLINELNIGTDDILSDEEISQVSWLTRTERPGTIIERLPVDNTQTPPSSRMYDSDTDLEGPDRSGPNLASTEERRANFPIYPGTSIAFDSTGTFRQSFRPLPATVNHEVDAPQYRDVLEHVRKQVESLGNSLQDGTVFTAEDLLSSLAALTLESTKLDPADYPSLFGSDVWLSKFRVGAAGELFIYSILNRLSQNRVGLDSWQSRIRHLVQAHEQYRHVTRWDLPETADITYKDQGNLLRDFFLSKPVGDAFPSWQLDGLANLNEIEWLFEVKTTIGPCETSFFMSQNQYRMMRDLGKQDNATRRQVYCIVRIYNLLSDRIGIRIFFDPWRFREGQLEFDTTEKWRVTAS